MFFSEVFDVLDEFGGVDDFDVVGEADDEAANATIVGDEGVKNPMGAIRLKDIILGHGVLLDEQAVSPHAQAKLDTVTVEACHAERVNKAFAMRVAVFPSGGKHLGIVDAGHLEGLVLAVFKIIAPDFSVVGGEFVRLHVAVADGCRVGRGIVVEDDLLVLLDGGGHSADVFLVLVFHGAFWQVERVDERAELCPDVLPEERVVGNVVEGFPEHMGFFVGEVHHLGEVFCLFGGEAVASVMIYDRQAAFLQVFEITVDGGGGHPKLLGEFGSGEAFACGEDGDEFYHLSDFRVCIIGHLYLRFDNNRVLWRKGYISFSHGIGKIRGWLKSASRCHKDTDLLVVTKRYISRFICFFACGAEIVVSSTQGVEEDEEFEEKRLFFRKCSIFAEIYRALCSCSWFGIW